MPSRYEGIPIDPALLSDDDPEEEDELGNQFYDEDQDSSGLDNDSEDAYEGEEGAGPSTSRTTRQNGQNGDAVFSRLAGFVSRTDQGQSVDLGGLNIEQEIAQANVDDIEEERNLRPSTRRKTQHRPSHEVQQLVGKANMAYARGDTQLTVDLFLEVIRHDPYVIAAWNTLASVYDEDGNEEGARQMRFFAAHVEDEADTWKELAMEFRQKGQITQCIYSLRKALHRDSGDVGVLFELASIYRLRGEASKAGPVVKRILRLHPQSTYDFTFLASFHSLLLEGNNLALAMSTFRTAFDHHLTSIRSPDEPESTMQLEHIVTLVDDMISKEELEEAVVVIRRGQRWLQGRGDQVQYDTLEDDREYDPPGVTRDGGSEPVRDSEDNEGFPMGTPLRHRLALLRLRLGDDNEAMIHIEEILNLDVMQYHDLFLEIGNALLKREMWEKALDCLAVIQECEGIPDDPAHIYAIAICHHQMKDHTQALEALQWVVSADPENLEVKLRMATVLEDMGRRAEALEMVSEVIKQRAQVERTDEEARRKGRGPSKSEKAGQRRLTKAVLEEQMKLKMQSLWEEVQEAEAGIAEGDMGALERFIYAAGTMVENYRLARSNFTKSRGTVRVLKREKTARKADVGSQALALQDRLEREMGFEDDAPAEEEAQGEVSSSGKYIIKRKTEFYGLESEDWLNLVIKYCCVLMVKNEEDVAMDILEHVIWSALFSNKRSELALRMTIIACSLRMKAYDKIVDNGKRLAQMHQFRSEPLLLILGALAGGGSKAAAAFASLQLHKFVHRDLRIQDGIIRGQKAVFGPKMGRWTTSQKVGLSRVLGDDLGDKPDDDDDEDPGEEGDEEDQEGGDAAAIEAEYPKPTKFSPVLYAFYGQHMLATKAYQSALFYLLRAFEAVPNDAFLCLLIAQAFFGRAANRQSDNRHYQITQGLAFLTKYRKYSARDVLSREEIEYNYARSFHGLGITHLAIRHYEAVLTSVAGRMQESDDPEAVKDGSLAMEAAHNLITIYAVVGSTEMVKQKARWLAL